LQAVAAGKAVMSVRCCSKKPPHPHAAWAQHAQYGVLAREFKNKAAL
jgi:hypothetical protein